MRRARNFLLPGSTAIVALALLTGPAAAAPRPIQKLAVLPIINPATGGEATISSVYSDIADAAAFRIGLRLLSYEEIEVVSGKGLSSRVQDCGSDTACIAERLRAFDARLGLVVSVDLKASPPLIGLQLLDTDDRKMVGESFGELGAQDGGLSAAVRARARKLFEDSGFKQAARVVIEVTPPNAKISLGGDAEPDQGTPNIFTVPPGNYDVTAQLDGYDSAKGQLVALGGRDTKLALSLDKQSSMVESIWFWAAVGAVVAGGTTAAILATRQTTRCVCVQLMTADGLKGCEACPP